MGHRRNDLYPWEPPHEPLKGCDQVCSPPPRLSPGAGLLPEPLPWKKARDASALTRTLADTRVLSGGSPELRLQVPRGPELHLPQYNQNVGKTVFLLV